MYPTKQLAVAQMKIMLEQTKSLWFQSISEARPNPGKDALLRAWAAQHSVMENANAIAQLAIRTCGGLAMLRSLPLERLYRDSRCGALMLPWTAELCLDMIGKGALYEAARATRTSTPCSSCGSTESLQASPVPGRAAGP